MFEYAIGVVGNGHCCGNAQINDQACFLRGLRGGMDDGEGCIFVGRQMVALAPVNQSANGIANMGRVVPMAQGRDTGWREIDNFNI